MFGDFFFLSYYEWRDELYYGAIHLERVFVFKKNLNLSVAFLKRSVIRESEV